MEFDLLPRFLLVFSTLFVIVDPIAAVPNFLVLTKDYVSPERRKTAIKACIFGALSLVFFSIFGKPAFELLRLDINAFRAGGGLLLLLTSLDMLRARNKECRCSPDELASRDEREDISFVPLAIPMLAGPGAITSVMVFSTDHEAEHVLNFLVILASIALTFLITFSVLRSSELVKRVLGKSGISVVQRLMGLLLAALSLQLIAEGGVKLIKSLL